jgi:spore coat protein CotH
MACPETRGEEAQGVEKLHIGVDKQGQIVASKVTESNEQDSSQVPVLLSQVDQPLSGFRNRLGCENLSLAITSPSGVPCRHGNTGNINT